VTASCLNAASPVDQPRDARRAAPQTCTPTACLACECAAVASSSPVSSRPLQQRPDGRIAAMSSNFTASNQLHVDCWCCSAAGVLVGITGDGRCGCGDVPGRVDGRAGTGSRSVCVYTALEDQPDQDLRNNADHRWSGGGNPRSYIPVHGRPSGARPPNGGRAGGEGSHALGNPAG
jgi:hypothetical protein